MLGNTLNEFMDDMHYNDFILQEILEDINENSLWIY